MIAEAAASVPLLLYDGDTEIEDHPLLDLLARPAPGQTGVDLLEASTASCWFPATPTSRRWRIAGGIRELHALRPDRVQVDPRRRRLARRLRLHRRRPDRAHRRRGRAGHRRASCTCACSIPLNDHYGLSPIEAAATAIDIHNEAGALEQGAARQLGAALGRAGLRRRRERSTPSQFERLKSELEASFQGARNAGRPLLLEGGLDWKSMSLSPARHGFHRGQAAGRPRDRPRPRRAADAAGAPRRQYVLELQEANRAFWRQTVLPLSVRTAKALSAWLGQGLELRCDLDALEALAPEREALWARLEARAS